MVYQVMLQTAAGWALFSRPTYSAHEAFELARLSAGYAPGMEACVLCAPTLTELQARCTQWQREHTARSARGASPTAPQTVEQWHALMNAHELGPGGDHDEPYTYHPAPHLTLATAWLHLAARVVRGEIGGALDGNDDAPRQAQAAPGSRTLLPRRDQPDPHEALGAARPTAGTASCVPSDSPP